MALETGDVDGEPIRLDVTDATSVFYNVNNRNTRVGELATHLDDDWGVWYNRLNTQGSWKSLQFGLRLDNATFFAAPDPTQVSLDLLRERHGGTLPSTYTNDDAAFFAEKTTEASRDLTTRYTELALPVEVLRRLPRAAMSRRPWATSTRS